MFRLNTNLRNKLLGRQAASTGNGLSGTFYQFIIDVYTGTQPASADAAPTGTYLGSFSKDAADKTIAANGLIFDAPASGAIAKNTDNWKMIGVAAGTMGWGRARIIGDDNTLNGAYPRMDFSIATTGGDMTVSSVNVTVGSSHTVDTFTVTMPAQ